jgi:LuxR family maltose regulon positive regulatory protein
VQKLHRPHQPARLRLAPELGLRRPPWRGPRREAVARPRLVRPLIDAPRRIAVVVAPAGYGKSAVLSEWGERDPRPFAWVSLGPSDDHADGLVASVATALGVVHPPAWGATTLDDLISSLGSLAPSVLAIDGVHELRSDAARDVVATIAEHVPAGVTLGLASRAEPRLPLARLRAQDDVVELRSDRLAMTRTEGAEMLHRGGLRLTPAQMDRVLELAAGWPAALQLAARVLREADHIAVALASFGGDDSAIVSYVQDEILSELDAEERAFLRRSAVLDPLSGEVCDAVLERADSGVVLRRLAGTNVPLVALDRAQLRFGHHPLVAQALRAELRCVEPARELELHRRASAWYEAVGDFDSAIEHGVEGRDAPRVAELLGGRAVADIASGRARAIDGWLARMTADDLATHPVLATTTALSRLLAGERDVAEAWAAAAGQHHGANGLVTASIAVVDAAVARDGVARMAHDAERAYAAAPGQGPLRAFACLLLGTSRCLAGDEAGAGERLDEGARRAIIDASLVRALCLAELVLLAAERDDWHHAAELADAGRATVERRGLQGEPIAALVYAASAMALSHQGHVELARCDVDAAARRLDLLPDIAPWYGAMVRLALARAELRLSDAQAARRLLTGASRLVRQTHGAGGLQAWLDRGWARADDYAAGPAACLSALTIAELRVLRFLPSHLTFREIGARLNVSANTVKTQAHAIYRKLDVRSRSEAVVRARAVGLIDG